MKYIILIITLFIFGFYGCSGDQTRSPEPQKKIVKKKVLKTKKLKEEVQDDTEVSLESDFSDTEETENNMDLEFNNEKEDDADVNEVPDEELDTKRRIKRIDFEPKSPNTLSDINIFANIIPGPSGDESVIYDFFKNGTQIVWNSTKKMLSKDQFKKGDFIAVKVMIIKDLEIIAERRTDLLQIGNSNPKFVNIPAFTMSGFKTYTYDLVAEDIDNDSITYELEGDIPEGMSIDNFTGRITFDFLEKPSKTTYTFNMIALDPDGGKDSREIKLRFKEERVKAN